MIRVSDFKVNNNVMSFSYYCENQKEQKGSVEYDLKEQKPIIIKAAPIEKNKTFYAKKAITYAKEMIGTTLTEKIFIWY